MTALAMVLLCFLSPALPWRTHGQSARWRCSQLNPVKKPSRERTFWVEPRDKSALTTALEGGIDNFLFRPGEDSTRWRSLGRFNAVEVGDDGEFEGGKLFTLSTPKDVEDIIALAGSDGIVIIDPKDWRAIPAENIIAAFQATGTQLFAVVETPENARSMLEMLEVGVDGVVLRTADNTHVRRLLKVRDDIKNLSNADMGDFSFATVTEVRQVGSGERVCVDTCSVLGEDEGLLVGSSSQAMFLVLSEAAKVDYISSRPFRVNAGPVHSYCAVPGGKTKYLSELQAGDEVLVFSSEGSCRTAVVGRSKVETRPLSMVVASLGSDAGSKATLFVQNAETVRLATVDREESMTMTSISRLQQGDRLLVRTESQARHIGMAIEENIVEK